MFHGSIDELSHNYASVYSYAMRNYVHLRNVYVILLFSINRKIFLYISLSYFLFSIYIFCATLRAYLKVSTFINLQIEA